MMSSENLQQTYSTSNNDCLKLLDTLFQTDRSSDSMDKAFKFFEDNFKTQPIIIYKLVDYYFDQRYKPEHSADSSYAETEFFYSENSKSILDLLFSVPEELSHKIFDRLGDKLSGLQSGSSTNLSSSAAGNNFRLFDRTLYLLIVISYRKKNWISKLLSHNLLAAIIKIILKGNVIYNDFLAVQTSLFFVSLINIVPHQNLENIFNIFLFLFKYLTNLERQKNEDSISYRNVKWSVRLYFYVCYGLYGNLFIQFIRKKDQTSINRDFLLSIIFYLRLHPSLFPEKNDSEKQLKYQNDDFSLEWRQYCLDPMCTNYNSSVQKLLKSSPATLNGNLGNCFLFNDHQFSIASHENLLNQPASPSYIFSSNRKCFIENEAISKRNFSAQSSIPSTPTPMLNQAFQFPLIECFPFDANQQDKKQLLNLDSNLSKNLTSHFMNEQIDSTQTLFHDSTESNKSQAQIRLLNKKKSFSEPNLNIDFEKSDCYLRHKQVKSEMKDTNINQPCEFGFDLFPKKLSNTPITTDSSTNTCDDDNIFSSQKSLLNQNTSESSDIVNAYIMGLSHNAKETDSNQAIARLKQEINHLVIQLIYERNLRNRYEEDSNRLHFIKIERDQLVTEKRFLEKNLKQQVEGYKNEVEECISIQNKSEIKAYKEELDQKNEVIEALRKKLDETENRVGELLSENEELKKQVKTKTLECDKQFQKLENEANLKAKNEIDANYVKSLRYTVDLLRKKILIMAKSHKKIESFYQEDAINYQLNRDLNFPNEGQFDKYIDLAYGSIFQQTSLYQFQQKTIEIQKKEIEQLRIENRNLLAQHNEHGLELEKITQMLNLKTIEVDELRQTLLMEVVHMKGELIKSHYRIQTSLMKVNKRLEEEVLKLKSNLSEKTEINSKLLEKIDQMQISMDELKMLKFSSFFETEDECD